MKDLGKKIVPWLIGIAVFVASVDVIVWLFEKFILGKGYEFTVKWGIVIPIVLYFVFTFVYWCYRRHKKKK